MRFVCSARPSRSPITAVPQLAWGMSFRDRRFAFMSSFSLIVRSVSATLPAGTRGTVLPLVLQNSTANNTIPRALSAGTVLNGVWWYVVCQIGINKDLTQWPPQLIWTCGTENALLSVQELEKCEYQFTGTSPALCLPPNAEELKHEEL